MRYSLFLSFLLGLTACVTAVGTEYGPADAKGYGYTQTRLEDDRFRVAFSGDGATPPGVVEDFALRRAAELALDNGYDWFRVIGRDLEGQQRGGVGVGAGLGTGSYGRRGGVNVGVGGDLGTIGARRFYTARLEILLGKGDAPDSDDIYDARQVLESIPVVQQAPNAPAAL